MQTLDEAKAGFERRYIASLLRATNGNVTTAAKIAGRNRTEFYNLLSRHSLQPEEFRRRND
jgi:two-component system response regulator GlrR